ncbi:glycosyltransferase family 4 protein [Acidimangrovimonas sediminis]|uniref:glycosyltransferase family 4 protein n=1 Tax=Acidimangrovimonas sediminis TaxID=2056283 RepID=UPI000C80A288|nr:glycosyltransferase family 4 protein [Acidimangrovimonas sediminis]
MDILFVHQNFPGQYRQLAEWLAATGDHRLVFLTQRRDVAGFPGIHLRPYSPHHRPASDAYGLSRHFEECMGAGYGAAREAAKLKDEGFTPDVILGHVGWGELTFLKEVWPGTPILGYFEYFYLAQGGSVGFDPEFPPGADSPYILHARNAVNHLNLATVDLGQCPTGWQMQTFPQAFRDRSYVCHDGIRTDRLGPDPGAGIALGRLGRSLSREDEVFTYMARNMEPTRGFHVFMRALPHILDARPSARAVIVGGNEVSYGKGSAAQGGYRAEMEAELGDRVDWSRVHFLGRIPFEAYCRVIQLSRCHVYLTVPFVLSWSLLEAMAMQATIVASDTAPVREVIRHGENGLLADFFDPEALARQVVEVLSRPADFVALGPRARRDVVATYDFLSATLPEHLARINSLVPAAKRIALPSERGG